MNMTKQRGETSEICEISYFGYSTTCTVSTKLVDAALFEGDIDAQQMIVCLLDMAHPGCIPLNHWLDAFDKRLEIKRISHDS